MSSALAIAYRKPASGWLAPLFLLSIGLHLGAATLALWASHHRQDISNEGDTGPGGTPGETTVELVAPFSSDPPIPDPPIPDPPIPDPPIPDPPIPDPLIPDPPIPDVRNPDADFVERKTNETPKVHPKTPPARDSAKKGLAYRAGVNDGNDTQGNSEGTPGLKSSTATAGYRPELPYPDAARAARIQGEGLMRVTYGPTGSVTTVIITRPINPLLDANTRSFVSKHWKGMPNTTTTHPVHYVLHGPARR